MNFKMLLCGCAMIVASHNVCASDDETEDTVLQSSNGGITGRGTHGGTPAEEVLRQAAVRRHIEDGMGTHTESFDHAPGNSVSGLGGGSGLGLGTVSGLGGTVSGLHLFGGGATGITGTSGLAARQQQRRVQAAAAVSGGFGHTASPIGGHENVDPFATQSGLSGEARAWLVSQTSTLTELAADLPGALGVSVTAALQPFLVPHDEDMQDHLDVLYGLLTTHDASEEATDESRAQVSAFRALLGQIMAAHPAAEEEEGGAMRRTPTNGGHEADDEAEDGSQQANDGAGEEEEEDDNDSNDSTTGSQQGTRNADGTQGGEE